MYSSVFYTTIMPWVYTMCIIAFILWAYDKHRAVYRKWRIPEFVLGVAAVLGGAFGALCGMIIFNHKVRKPLFYIGVPVVLFIQIAIFVLLLTDLI